MIMRKNKHAHNGESGILSVAEGYAKNARPEPDAATSLMGLFWAFAIKPMILNTTKPAKNDVPELTQDMIRVSR